MYIENLKRKHSSELKGKREVHKMDHLACFIVGVLALEALNENDSKRRGDTLKLAEEIANTCHESYVRTGKVYFACHI